MSPEALLTVALMAGFFGGGHCLGMCGPVVVLLEGQPSRGQAWQYRLLYNAGRGLFYMLLGAVAGGAGLVLTRIAGVDTGLRLLRWIAAGFVVALGLNLLFSLRLLNFLESGGAAIWRAISPLTRRLLPITTPPRALAVGFFWGALPCGLVYSSVALAATSGNALAGALVMLAFWLGTLPSLLVAGASAGKLALWSRRPLLRRVAGGLMIAVGLFALAMPMMTMKGGQAHGSTADESHAAAIHCVARRTAGPACLRRHPVARSS